MTRGVVSCGLEAQLSQAAKLMAVHRCHCLPVLECGHVIGVLTDRDLWSALNRHPNALAALKVGEVMSRDVAKIGPAEPIEASMRLMQQRRLRRLPVVAGGGELVGILSLDDLARKMALADSGERQAFEVTLRLVRGANCATPAMSFAGAAHA